MRYWLFLLALSANAAVEIAGGRYYIEIDGQASDQYFLQYHTALAEAVNQAQSCKCSVVVRQPEVTVKYKPETVNVLISWENIPDAQQYQLMIDDRMFEFPAGVVNFQTEVAVGSTIIVRYANSIGEYGEWSDPAVVEL